MKLHRSVLISLALLLGLAGCGKGVVILATPAVPRVATGAAMSPPTRPAAALTTPGRQPGCTVVSSRQPTPDPTLEVLLPLPTDKDWKRGPKDALVTIIEYGDFQDPGSAGLAPVMAKFLEKYPQDLQLVYRPYPILDKAALAAQAAEAAGAQGKFWEMYDRLFEQRDAWVNLSAEDFQKWVVKQAGDLGLDPAQFEKELTSPAVVTKIKQAYNYNTGIGMQGTPFLVVNGQPYGGPLSASSLESMISLYLLQKQQFSNCPPMELTPGKQYIATIKTAKGDIVLELFPDKAPLAVNNFIFLAKHGWYDNVTFHRVLPGFMAQAGDPTGTGYGGPGYAFDNEILPDLTFDSAGLLAMANAGPGSNGSQFFITYAPVPRLNGGYTIFGKVLSGMDVLQNITPRDPSRSMDLPPGDAILTITIEEK